MLLTSKLGIHIMKMQSKLGKQVEKSQNEKIKGQSMYIIDGEEILEMCKEENKIKQTKKKKKAMVMAGGIVRFLVTLVAVIVELALTHEMNVISLSGLFVGLTISRCLQTIVSWSNYKKIKDKTKLTIAILDTVIFAILLGLAVFSIYTMAVVIADGVLVIK